MDPNLVCKLVTAIANGDIPRGTGYPITPNRIITAAHVVEDALRAEGDRSDADVRQIRIYFGVREEAVEGPVAIEWSGAAVGVDVAVLRCNLKAQWQPGHELLTAASQHSMNWCARGYTAYGKTAARPGGKDAYYGKLVPFAEDESCVALGCHDGLISSEHWAGGSGSVAFLDAPMVHKALAVITDYQGGKKQDQLLAVPLNYLLNSEATREGFRRAIEFEAYQQRESYRDQCVDRITGLLQKLTDRLKEDIAEGIIQDYAKGDDIGINPGDSKHVAAQIAAYIVNHLEVMEAAGYLFNLTLRVKECDTEILHGIMDYLLALNYTPDVVRRLYAQVVYNRFGFVENAVATRTAAEIIMAGYDQQPANFVLIAGKEDRIQGLPALNVDAAPEQGLGDLDPDRGLLLAVRSDLLGLLREKDRVLGLPTRVGQKSPVGPIEDEALKREIQTYATQLRGALMAFQQGVHRGRRMYCVLILPQEPKQREFRKRVLHRICEYIPELVFIELIETPTDAREFTVDTYLQMRFLAASQGQAS